MLKTVKLNLDTDKFLAENWQRKPLLVRDALPGFAAPIDANELAGLAMEDAVESRIIESRGDAWQLFHGPFLETDFQREAPWTLLVQAVDHYVPDVASLLKLVDFIPGWRVDDVMISYAVDGGSVGPHYDNYDVFLLQGEGTRCWQLGQSCHSASPLLPHPELRILADFDCSAEYILEPGDMLYIPPGVAHWGIARGECTTFSLGFRAPRINDMLSRWVDELLENIDPELFYCDAGLSTAALPGEIRDEDMARVRAQINAALQKQSTGHWFGELVTEPRYPPETSEQEIEDGRTLLRGRPSAITLLPSAKLAWRQNSASIDVFANGESLNFSECIRPIVISLCKYRTLAGKSLEQAQASPEYQVLLDELLLRGCISIE